MTTIQFIVINLFCGAGGTTVGFEEAQAQLPGQVVAKVVACVNHDPLAIESHWNNHPDVEHFEEDITKLYGFYQDGILLKSPRFLRLVRLIDMYRAFHPEAILNAADFGTLTSRNRLFGCFAKPSLPIVWPEPTHAKNPEKTTIMRPLRKWEPVKKALDFSDEGNSVFNRKKPLSPKTMQRLFMGCVKHIAGGKHAFLSKYYSGKPGDKNSSIDHPAPTVTTKPHESLVFMTKWNSNNGKTGGNNGHSVHGPAPVVTTQNRLGLAFITKAFSSNSGKGVNSGVSVEGPCPTITAQNRLGIAQVNFISKYNGVNGGKHHNSDSVDGPVGSIRTGDGMAKVTANFIDQQFSQGKQNQSVDEPLGAITTVPKSKIVSAHFIDKQFSGPPAGAILGNDKHSLITAEKWLMSGNFDRASKSIEEPAPTLTASRRHHYLVNPSWGGNSGSVEEPCHVVIARQDKAPLYLITCKHGPVVVPIYEDDCEWTVKLKEFMVLYDIVDIKMRMLKVQELKVIQGFPADYILMGNQTDQKKFIGNAVHPKVPRFWIEAMSRRLAV